MPRECARIANKNSRAELFQQNVDGGFWRSENAIKASERIPDEEKKKKIPEDGREQPRRNCSETALKVHEWDTRGGGGEGSDSGDFGVETEGALMEQALHDGRPTAEQILHGRRRWWHRRWWRQREAQVRPSSRRIFPTALAVQQPLVMCLQRRFVLLYTHTHTHTHI